MVFTCVLCGVDAGLRGAVLICVTAQSAADLVNLIIQIISYRGVSAVAGRAGEIKIKRARPWPGSVEHL